MADQTLNLPSLLFIVILSSLAIRYFFFTPRTPPHGTRGRIDPAHVDQIATMFPQVDRRSIQWDLHRNGGSIAATTERILARGSLDRPPLSFQPPMPPVALAPPRVAPPPIAPQPDLITRYNLKSKLSTAESSVESSEQRIPDKGSWSESKNERAELLRRRREEMILNARRKMESKEKQASR